MRKGKENTRDRRKHDSFIILEIEFYCTSISFNKIQ